MIWAWLLGGAALLAGLARGRRRVRPAGRQRLRRIQDLTGRSRDIAEAVLDELVRPLGDYLGQVPVPVGIDLVDGGACVAVTLRTDAPERVAYAVVELGLPVWLVIVRGGDVVVHLALTFTPDESPRLVRQVGAGFEEL